MSNDEKGVLEAGRDFFTRLFGGSPSDQGGTTEAKTTLATPTPDPDKVRLEAQVIEFKRKAWSAEAERFMEANAKKLLPAERGIASALLAQALEDDDAHSATLAFKVGDEEKKLTRAEALKTAYANRPDHGLTEEHFANNADALLVMANREKTDEKTKLSATFTDDIYSARQKAMANGGGS